MPAQIRTRLLVVGIALASPIACGSPAPTVDQLVFRQVLTAISSTPIHLPAGQYTIGAEFAPDSCAGPAVSVLGSSGSRVLPEGVPIFHKDFPAGDYTFSIKTHESNMTCIWKLQIVMNRPAGNNSPPSVFPVLLPHTLRFSGIDSGAITVPVAGDYKVEPAITEDSSQCPRVMRLTGPLGFQLNASLPDKGGTTLDTHLLLDGTWRIETSSQCRWILVLSPVPGHSGGATNF